MLHRISKEEAEALTAGLEPCVLADYEGCKAYYWNLPDGREVSYTYDVNDEGAVMTDGYFLIDSKIDGKPLPRILD